ncbi:MAG: hypothetical protein HQK54_09990 [Oligoflexales bacterium]|nr:hypothetical protein [Oligoflexales bacterium]
MYYKRNAIHGEFIICALNPFKEDKKAQQKLLGLLDINRKTLKVFRKWWRKRFGQSVFAKMRSSLIPGLSSDNPANAIYAYFQRIIPDNPKKVLVRAICFLAGYRTDFHWCQHRLRNGGLLGLTANISPFSMV